MFRTPTIDDARAVSALIAASPPLDANSLYCTLLQCTHFAGTCVVAEKDGALEGWISGYRPPDQPETMFVWQVAVREGARGSGLGVAMLEALLSRQDPSAPAWVKTTVTPSNEASRRMFARFAKRRQAQVFEIAWFDQGQHFGGQHESEKLIAIGPL
ncbi:diaminobutyrate acetyltransferase [Novosphingobium sp. G106]|nr:diaminobutyrate acetyltransferase [Novosphingobium sp. G106]